MKNFKIFIAILFATATMVGCVEDELMLADLPDVEESPLKLNEIMSKDVDPNPDWIEVYNSGATDIDISGYILNDKKEATGGFAIPNGTIIKAGGFYVVDSDESGESISSGGEDVCLAKPDGTVIDLTTTPDMSSNIGLTWGREIDGDGEWKIGSPTPGASNGAAGNTAPILGASPLTELTTVYSVTASDADGIASVKLVLMINDGVQSIDMALVEGEYKTSVPKTKVGDVVKYYVIATDKGGLSSIYPENGQESPASFTVMGGVEELTFNEIETSAGIYEFHFEAKVLYTDQVDEVRLYYLLPGESQDDVSGSADDKHTVKNLPLKDGMYIGSVTDIEKNTELRYYIRVEYADGTKTYYPMEENEGEFNHDLGTTWPTVTVGQIPVAAVNGFSDLTIENEAGSDLNYSVKIEYENGIEEVKFYYIINYNAETYVEDNDRHDLEWSGDLPSSDNVYTFSIPANELTAGDNISWYFRAKDGSGEKMYYTFGKTANEFDGDIKDNPASWNVIVKN